MKLDIIGQRLRRVRKLLGITRKEIQDKYNFPANTIKVWESGKTEIGIIRLGNYLNIFKEYGVFLSIDSFINSKDDSLDKVILSRNAPTYNLNNQASSQSLKNVEDLQLIHEGITRTIGSILEEKEEILQSLFDNLPTKIVFKDENNTIVNLNSLAAQGLGGIVSDFKGKNVYNLFPKMAEKYHKDDLEVLKTNKSINVVDEIIPINSVSSKIINITRTPIFNRENKKMILAVWKPIIGSVANLGRE